MNLINYIDYNTDIEDAVLGASIIELSAFSRIVNLIDAEHFYKIENIELFNAMKDMFNSGIPIDLLTIRNYLIKNKININISYLCEIVNKVGSSANIEYHSLILRQLAGNRILKTIKSKIDTDNDCIEEIQELQKKLNKIAEINVTNDWQDFRDIALDIYKNIEDDEEQGIFIGLQEFDNISGGIKNGEVMIVGARPSVGKTAIACQFALNIAKNKKSVGIISLEMTNTKLATRIISQITELEYWKIDRKKLQQYEINSFKTTLDDSLNLPIYFSEKTGVTALDIEIKTEKLKSRGNLDILFIDYLGLIEPEKANNREQEISKISRRLKLLALRLNIPIIVLAQLSRESEKRTNKKPQLSDLRDSGSIEQDADIVMFLHSDFKSGILTDAQGNTTENQREIIIAKYRNGYTKNFKVGFDGEKMKFLPEIQYEQVFIQKIEDSIF